MAFMRWVEGKSRTRTDVTDAGSFSPQTIPSSFPLSKLRNSKKPTSLLSHLVFTHQTTLSASDLALYDGDLPGAEHEVRRYEREGVRLFGVGGVGSELVEWEWGGPGAGKEVGRVKVRSCEIGIAKREADLCAVYAADSPSHLCARCIQVLFVPRHWLRGFDHKDPQYPRRRTRAHLQDRGRRAWQSASSLSRLGTSCQPYHPQGQVER